jgi:D-alanine-D-alanine ligase
MKKIKIAILSGGPSSEHEVSLKSGENVVKNLDLNRFEIVPITITKDRVWVDRVNEIELSENDAIEHLKKEAIDIVFIALHGEYGEDGTLQKLLEEKGLRFTGSGSTASAVAMDKVLTTSALKKAGLSVPLHQEITKSDWKENKKDLTEDVLKNIGLPCVVKPVSGGSSIGIHIVRDLDSLTAAVNDAFEYGERILVQKFIAGRELTCAVLEQKDGSEIPLVPTEIMPKDTSTFFDYEAKYTPGASIEVTPPDMPDSKIKQIQNAALLAHVAIGCKGISRTDFIITKDELFLLEINTIPGMTETSLVPQGAAAMGIDFSILVESIIEASLK